MDWLKKFFREDHSTPLLREGQNPIHCWLDTHDIPWRDNRGDLIARYGVTEQPDRLYPAVELDVPRRPIKGLIRPLYIQLSDHFSPYVPAGELLGDAYYGPDERGNIRRVAKELSAFLGPADVHDHLNTVRALWTFDRAKVRLLAWPGDKQRVRSSWESADDRDPRLRLGCYITVHTGLLIEPTDAELGQLRSFVPICALPPSRGIGTVDDWNANQSELEFLREPAGVEGVAGAIGTSSDRTALIFQTTNLFLIKMAQIQAIHVERTRPGKGPGGSELQVEVRPDYDGVELKRVTLCESPGADDLSEIGDLIASAIGKPLKLSPYYYDC